MKHMNTEAKIAGSSFTQCTMMTTNLDVLGSREISTVLLKCLVADRVSKLEDRTLGLHS